MNKDGAVRFSALAINYGGALTHSDRFPPEHMQQPVDTGAVAAVRELRMEGWSLVLASNAGAHQDRPLALRPAGIEDLFTALVVSHDIGVDKPCDAFLPGSPGRWFGVFGTVMSVPLNELPHWLPAWCLDHLGSGPSDVLFRSQQVSMVFGLRLAGGRDVVVKARADEGRAASCVAAQARLAERGFPCARPLTPVVGVGALAVHAEEFRPGGEVLHGDSPDLAVRCAEVFARLMAELAGVIVAPPLPNPPWVRWDETGSGTWPAMDFLDDLDQSVVSEHIVQAAERARGRLLTAGLPCVLGHADFEAQNLRWQGRQVWAVHDWDSLAWQPEAALVGAASGSFASAGSPTLAPIESSAAFLAAYQDFRGRLFTPVELEIAWAASVWMAAYNAREMALCGGPPAGGDALRAQAAERLRRANA